MIDITYKYKMLNIRSKTSFMNSLSLINLSVVTRTINSQLSAFLRPRYILF